MEELKNKPPSSNNGHHQTDSQLLTKCILLISLTVAGGILSQNIYHWVGQNSLGLLAGLFAFAAVMVMYAKPLFKIIGTPHFTVPNLIAIALATAVGTFVPQKTDMASGGLVGLLQLNDLFHSWWYVSLYALLAVGLVKSSSKKRFTKENVGFHLAHLSPILILFGFWVDYFMGFRGIIKLEEGQQKSTVLLYKGTSGFIHDSITLGFNIRLNHFEFEKHKPDYRIQIWKRDTIGRAVMVSHGETDDTNPPKIVASLPLEQGKIHRIYGTDRYYRLSEFYPDFEFDYKYPANTDTIAAKDPGILLDLKTPEGDAFVQFRANQSGRNKMADVVKMGAGLEFYWELPEDLAKGLVKSPVPADLAKDNRVIFDGKNEKIYFLINGLFAVKPLKIKQFYPISWNDSIGFSVRYLMPDVAYLQAVPSSKSEELNKPVAKVEVWKAGGPATVAYLYPSSNGDDSGVFKVPGNTHFLALESFKDKETKYYKSELSVINNKGEVLKQQSVKVNEPMLYNGYRFYQTDYDPNKPNYSGIGVSHEPGLMVIYLGFYLMVAGVAHMFYIKKKS